MKRIVLFCLVGALAAGPRLLAQTQPAGDLEVIDLSGRQLRLMAAWQNQPGAERDSLMVDSLYRPYQKLWSGYLGGPGDFLEWLNGDGFAQLDYFRSRALALDLDKLNAYFGETVEAMTEFTGHSPKGRWYVLFGPHWTNLGGFGDGTMLIDLAHPDNANTAAISQVFPHELNHQIYATTQPSGKAVMRRILDEGFACYVSYRFHKGTISKAESLGYTEEAFEYCRQKEPSLLGLLQQFVSSDDPGISNSFADRGVHVSEGYPGAIGYYLGFRIVEEYVVRNGADSWKDLYLLTPEEALEGSGLLE
jgi:hypothetical protein